MKDEYFKNFKQKGYLDRFDKKYFWEFEKQLEEVIIPLYDGWNKLSEERLEFLLKKLGQICRDEKSLLKNEFLTDDRLIPILLMIGIKYENNHKILIQIVSSINNIYIKYGLEITDEIFDFLLEQTNNIKVKFYVFIFITELPQFKILKTKWEYILSIPKIAPRKKSINTFYRVINDNLDLSLIHISGPRDA